MKTKIWMLNPPYFRKYSRSQRSPAVTKSGTLYYPIWLAYATGVLEEAGFSVKLIDAPAADYTVETLLNKAKIESPDLIVVDTSTPSIYNDVAVATKLKETLPESFVALVGTHVTALPEETLSISDKIDAVIRGEYDFTVLELAELLETRKHYNIKNGLSSIAGISYWYEGTIKHNPARPFIENLDAIPFVSKVYKKHLRIENYFNPNALYPMVTIVSGRGCPYRCIFCVYPQTLHGRKYRFRSVENVIEELEYIQRTFPQAKSVFFEDDTLTANKKRLIELTKKIRERKIKIPWTANARADLDRETLQHLAEAGCRMLCVGFESGNQALLDGIKKDISLEKSIQFMRHAREVGILVHGCFIIGLPGETKETMHQTLEFAKRLNCDTVQFYPLMVYPGTEAYNIFKEKGYLSTENFSEWLTEEGLHNCVIDLPGLTSNELTAFCDFARRKYYLRPKYIFYKLVQSFRYPREGKRNLKALRTFYKHLFYW